MPCSEPDSVVSWLDVAAYIEERAQYEREERGKGTNGNENASQGAEKSGANTPGGQ